MPYQNLEEILGLARSHSATDVHISAGQPPTFRINQEILRISQDILQPEDTKRLAYTMFGPKDAALFEENLDVDLAYTSQEHGRFRANVFLQHRGISAVLRPIRVDPPSRVDCPLPPILYQAIQASSGLILVTGPTGSGKTTTLAAMIHEINNASRKHIITIEEPIEFIHEGQKSLISQREVGIHAKSFSTALRAGLRENPDIILVGEMRDIETTNMALTAAETGHLVLSSLHTASTEHSINRIINIFPHEKQLLIQHTLADYLVAIVTQKLIIHTKGDRLTAVHEVLVANNAIRHLIRKGAVEQIHSALQTGMQYGMQTMDQAIVSHVRNGDINPMEARRHMSNPSLLS